MKTKKIIFIVYALIILLVPVYLVLKSESILTSGTFYKFKPQAYDPFDPFRGKFLRVNYDTDGIKTDDDISEGDRVFVSIAIDEDGYAYFDQAYINAPTEGDYLSTVINYMYDNEMGVEMGIEIPDHMNKYFINEDKALDAENVFRWKRDDIYIGIRILNGEARIEDIYVQGSPLLTFLEENDVDYEEMMMEEMMMEEMTCESGCEGGEACEAACEDGDVCEGACGEGDVCEPGCEGGDTDYEEVEVVPPPVEEVIEYENEEVDL